MLLSAYLHSTQKVPGISSLIKCPTKMLFSDLRAEQESVSVHSNGNSNGKHLIEE